MASKISVVINTLNEERNIERAIKSVDWADEIIVCDMHSDDKTVELARKMGAKIIYHKRVNYVEPARNFAISKASNEWVLILDADEEIEDTLAGRLQEISDKMEQIDYVKIPIKNLIFGHWMQHSGWWPDYKIRFFKKDKIEWTDKIHRPPETFGQGLDLPAEEKFALVHHNYETVSQFIRKMDRYTAIEAEELEKEGYKFEWRNLFEKPLGEFLSRFFAREGYKDGLHGLVLSMLQALSFLVVYLKLWEKDKFKEQNIDLPEVNAEKDKSVQAINYWIEKTKHPGNFFGRIFKKIKS